MMVLETPRLIIRDFGEADAGVLYEIKTDEAVRYFCPDFLDVEGAASDVVNYIRDFNRAETEHDPDPWRCYAIEIKETHEVVGCLCFGLQEMLREYELGWMMIGRFAAINSNMGIPPYGAFTRLFTMSAYHKDICDAMGFAPIIHFAV